jgi:hypothetical protein
MVSFIVELAEEILYGLDAFLISFLAKLVKLV